MKAWESHSQMLLALMSIVLKLGLITSWPRSRRDSDSKLLGLEPPEAIACSLGDHARLAHHIAHPGSTRAFLVSRPSRSMAGITKPHETNSGLRSPGAIRQWSFPPRRPGLAYSAGLHHEHLPRAHCICALHSSSLLRPSHQLHEPR